MKPMFAFLPLCCTARNTGAGAAFFAALTPDKLLSKESLERRLLVGPVVCTVQRVSDKQDAFHTTRRN